MQKSYFKHALVFVFLLGLISNSFAGNNFPFEKILKKKPPRLTNHQKVESTEAANFSGVWRGACSGSEYPVSLQLNIKHEADSIEINEEKYIIEPNHVHGRSAVSKEEGSYSHSQLFWLTENKNALKMITISADHMLEYEAQLDARLQTITFSMNDNKIMLRLERSFLTDEISFGHQIFNCSLDKLA